jgi:hypothetical protein
VAAVGSTSTISSAPETASKQHRSACKQHLMLAKQHLLHHLSHVAEAAPLASSLPTTTSPTHIPHCFIAHSLQTPPHHQHTSPLPPPTHTHAFPPSLAHGRTHTHKHTETGGHACDNGRRSHGRLLLPPKQGPGVCVCVCVCVCE